MRKPFRIVLDLNRPVRREVGRLMAVDIAIEGLPDGLQEVEELTMALSFVLASHMKGLVDGPPEQTKKAFMRFMSGVWDDAPAAIPIETMAEA